MLRSAIRAGVFLCALVTAIGGRAFAAPVEAGSYQIRQGGSEVGSERFAWRVDEAGRSILEGESIRDIDGVPTQLTTSLTLAGERLVPVEYRREMIRGAESFQLETTFDGGKAIQATRVRETSSKKTVKIRPAGMVVDGPALHLYAVLARLYDFTRGGDQDITVYDPGTSRAYVARAMLRGLGTFENRSGSWRLQRLTVNLEDVAVDLLVDDQGRVAQISIPLKGLEGRLEGYSGGEQAARVR